MGIIILDFPSRPLGTCFSFQIHFVLPSLLWTPSNDRSVSSSWQGPSCLLPFWDWYESAVLLLLPADGWMSAWSSIPSPLCFTLLPLCSLLGPWIAPFYLLFLLNYLFFSFLLVSPPLSAMQWTSSSALLLLCYFFPLPCFLHFYKSLQSTSSLPFQVPCPADV